MDERRILKCLRLLELPDSFSEGQLKEAYRDLVQVWHPDKHAHNDRLRHKAEEKMKGINEAYEFLQSRLVSGKFHFDHLAASRHRSNSGRHASTHSCKPTPSSSEPVRPSGSADKKKGTANNLSRSNGYAIMVVFACCMAVIVYAALFMTDKPRPSVVWLQSVANSAIVRLESLRVRKALDENNGFKDLHFGMSVEEALKTLSPAQIVTNGPGRVQMSLTNGPMIKLGDFTFDQVIASFFKDRLFRIDILFSHNQEQIYQTFEQTFGKPSKHYKWQTWEPARSNTWIGKKVICGIFARMSSEGRIPWTAIVMYDRAIYEDLKNHNKK